MRNELADRLRDLTARVQRKVAIIATEEAGWAIDMSIRWDADLAIQTAGGAVQTITTLPRTGGGNTALYGVGAGYGVLKLVVDRPHWSDNGH